MKLRRTISLLLLALYLTAAGGPALLSLSCDCVRMHAHTAHACCHETCLHEACETEVSAHAVFSAQCCGDRHSNEIELYTGVSPENDRNLRCAVISLPPSLAAECPCPAHVPVLREKTAERRAPFVPDIWLPATGFRAPPVLV